MKKEVLYSEKLEVAPKQIKDLMAYENSIDTLKYLWKTYGIEDDYEKCQTLSFEIGCVLLGITHPKDFISQLEKEVGVSKETAQSIAKDVNEKIFKSVKDLLIEMHNLKSPQSDSNTKTTPDDTQQSKTSPDLFEKKLKQSVLAEHTLQPTKIPVTKDGEEVEVKTPPAPQKDSYREPIE